MVVTINLGIYLFFAQRPDGSSIHQDVHSALLTNPNSKVFSHPRLPRRIASKGIGTNGHSIAFSCLFCFHDLFFHLLLRFTLNYKRKGQLEEALYEPEQNMFSLQIEFEGKHFHQLTYLSGSFKEATDRD